ncbi:hypothetical protein [Microbacterium sp. K24]|uniref:hypothetical protein n=1 Tax=Microbacterium sp. K24 TaxID=2305446 RepID=UPI001F10F2C4|nr:hypothetical protein [Microbacterium sp. K24]
MLGRDDDMSIRIERGVHTRADADDHTLSDLSREPLPCEPVLLEQRSSRHPSVMGDDVRGRDHPSILERLRSSSARTGEMWTG